MMNLERILEETQLLCQQMLPYQLEPDNKDEDTNYYIGFLRRPRDLCIQVNWKNQNDTKWIHYFDSVEHVGNVAAETGAEMEGGYIRWSRLKKLT